MQPFPGSCVCVSWRGGAVRQLLAGLGAWVCEDGVLYHRLYRCWCVMWLGFWMEWPLQVFLLLE